MLTDEQYRRVAQWLDGEDVSLDPVERSLAEEIRDDQQTLDGLLGASGADGLLDGDGGVAALAEVRRDELALGPRLDAVVGPEVIERVQRRVTAELARKRRRLTWVGAISGLAALAASVLLAVGLWPDAGPTRPGHPTTAARRTAERLPAEVLAASVTPPSYAAADLVAAEISDLQADLVASIPSATVDAGIDQVEKALQDFWLDDMWD